MSPEMETKMENNLTIKQMQKDYRPDEKFLSRGADALTSAELLAIILRTGARGEPSVEVARKLLYSETTGCEEVHRILDLDLEELLKVKGVGTVKALQIKAVAELARRIALSSRGTNEVFDSPDTIAGFYMEEMRHLKKEVVVLMLLDSACSLIKDIRLSTGTVNISLFSAREIFMEALKYGAVNIVLLHNHPSGNCTPSAADINATRNIKNMGNQLGIPLLDHIIIGDKKYLSFKEEGFFNE